MKKVCKAALTVVVMALCLSACESSSSELKIETPKKEANSLLQVRTRAMATSEEEVVSYPVNVYVFQGEKCEAVQTIENESDVLNIPLVEGSYTVYAIGGATSENYLLPSQEEASPTMNITLKEGKKHADLMVSRSSVTLGDGESNLLTLTMERMVMLLQSVVMKNVPVTATSVSVTIAPLWQNVVGTTYAGESGSEMVALTKQDDGRTWMSNTPLYLLPPSDNSTTITVSIGKQEGGTNSYTYNVAEQLESGNKINIQGTYTEVGGVTLSGTITGAKWKEEKNISFKFNEEGSTEDEWKDDENTGNGDEEDGDDSNIMTGTVPAVGETYKECFVLSVDDADGIASVLLLSPKVEIITDFTSGSTSSENVKIKIEEIMPQCAIEGIEAWRLMTMEELDICIQKEKEIPNWNDSYKYFMTVEDESIKVGSVSGIQVGRGFTFNANDKYALRPVAVVKFKRE